MGAAEDLEERRKQAIREGRCFSKGRLRDEFRMKPKPDARPVKTYRDGFGGRFGVFLVSDCIPLRERTQREPSEKELRARRLLGLRAKQSSARGMVGEAALWLLDEGAAVVLDTETTGLDDDSQIIEIAIVDASGAVLLESRLRPSVPIDPEARAVHGINDADLLDAPAWPELAPRIEAVLAGRVVVIFNAPFDLRMIQQTARAFSMTPDWLESIRPACAMELAVDAYGPTNRYGAISLASAAAAAKVSWTGRAHGARADALATLDLVRAIGAYRSALDEQVEALLR